MVKLQYNSSKVCKIEMKPSIGFSETCFHFRILSEENKKLAHQNLNVQDYLGTFYPIQLSCYNNAR